MGNRWERAQRPDRRRRRYELWCLVLTGLSIIAVAMPTHAAEVRYVYDLKGQIVGIVDADGSAAVYSWDDAGNLTGIVRIPAGVAPVAITLVNPIQGVSGATVELFGKGFSPIPANNVVTFNGVVAVLDATTVTANYLKVTVPATATTGFIHVQVGPNGADSPAPFTVLAATPPLTLSPSQAALAPGGQQQFTASLDSVTWLVNLLPGGNPQVGQITPGGLYTAPATGAFPLAVTVGARSPSDQRYAEALVEILAPVARAPRVTGVVASPPTQAAPLAAGRVTAARQPVITGVLPASVAQSAGGATLTLTGQGLGNPPSLLQFLLNGSPDPAFTVTGLTGSADGTSATATITFPGTVALGGRALQITAGVPSTPAGTGSNVLQITNP